MMNPSLTDVNSRLACYLCENDTNDFNILTGLNQHLKKKHDRQLSDDFKEECIKHTRDRNAKLVVSFLKKQNTQVCLSICQSWLSLLQKKLCISIYMSSEFQNIFSHPYC